MSRKIGFFLVLTFSCSVLRAADWLTDGINSQRTNWQQDERAFSPATVGQTTLLWKMKLDNEPRQMHNLFVPLLIGSLTTSKGPKQVAIVAGVSDNIFAIDVDKGELIWKKHFESAWTPPVSP